MTSESLIALGADQRPPMPPELQHLLLQAEADCKTLGELAYRLTNILHELEEWRYVNVPSPALLEWAAAHVDGLTERCQAILRETMRRRGRSSDQWTAARRESHDYQPVPLPSTGETE